MTAAFLALALMSHSHRVAFSSRSVCIRQAGTITDGASENYWFPVKAGDQLVVNVYGLTDGFGVVATALFPSGRQDGGKDMPNVVSAVTQSGLCEVTVGPNMMMDNFKTGRFMLEIVRYHDWSQN